MGITKLSETSGYPKHKIRYSLQFLEQEGLIEPSLQGAITTEDIDDIIKRLNNSINEIGAAYNEPVKN